MDEHRAGLKPVMRRVWVDEWTTPVARVKWQFQWLWLYGFVHPESGQTYWWLLPFVNHKLFSRVLADFARHFGIGKYKRVALVVDQAGWHTSEKVEVHVGIHLIPLPPYSPELQPAERLWTLTNEPVANRSFETRVAVGGGFGSTLSDVAQATRVYPWSHLLSLVTTSRGVSYG